MAASDIKEEISDIKEKEISSVRPKLFEIDSILNSIFIYCTEMEIVHIHDTVLVPEYKKYWQSVPIIIMFDMTSSLRSDILDKFCDILDLFKQNITTIAIRVNFDLFMNHIEYFEVETFFNKILICAQLHSLWRIRLIIKYKHCDSDYKWHELMHQLIINYMMLQIPNNNNKYNKFRKTATVRLSIRAMDFILFWKLHNKKYKEFLNNLKISTSIGQLQLEFGSLYKVHSNYSYIISNLFDAISSNISISGIALKSCIDDSDCNNYHGFTQNDQDLTSLLPQTTNNEFISDNTDNLDNSYLSYIYNCFKNKRIDPKCGGNNACWKKHSFYKFSCSEKDISLRINSKYGIKNILNAINENNNLCINCLVLENIIYDHNESEQDWDDPFNDKQETQEMDKHNVWKELLEICFSDKHFIEILEFEESIIGKTYCNDLQKFFNTIIYGNKFNKNNNKQCHIRRLEIDTISKHGTDVFIQYITDLMQNGLSYNPMLAQIKIKFDYIGDLKIFQTKFIKLIDAALFRIKSMIESQFAMEEYLKDCMGFSFGIIQLILQLSRFEKIKFEINEGKNRFITNNAAQRVQFTQIAIKSKINKQLREFDKKYESRNINKYLIWQYKDNVDDNNKEPKYVPNDPLMCKYMKLICSGDVCLEIGYKD